MRKFLSAMCLLAVSTGGVQVSESHAKEMFQGERHSLMIRCSADNGSGERLVKLTPSRSSPGFHYLAGDPEAGGDEVLIYKSTDEKFRIYAGADGIEENKILQRNALRMTVINNIGDPVASAAHYTAPGAGIRPGDTDTLRAGSLIATGVDYIFCDFTYLGKK